MKTERLNYDNLTAEQVGKLFPVQILPYNPEWEILFEREKTLIAGVLGEDVAINIEHFGSTSVVGLAAKPTIDILVEVPVMNDVFKQLIIQKLETLGYENMYNAEKEREMTFGKGYCKNCVCTQTYHVHIREKGHEPQKEICFRDILRQNPDARIEYENLKYALAEKHQYNREDYTQAKTEFIVKITEQQERKIKTDEDASR
jgi:GrpB-like predicted nucleotidyltransferase (UPF0157 family)